MADRCIKAAVAVRRHLWSRSTLVNNATALLPSYAALHRGTTVCCMSHVDINRNCDSELVDTIDQYADDLPPPPPPPEDDEGDVTTLATSTTYYDDGLF